MPTRKLRRSVLLHYLSRAGFAGLRFATILLLIAAGLSSAPLAWIGAATLVASLALWLACLPTDAEHAKLEAAGVLRSR
jgi:hypothetical protein